MGFEGPPVSPKPVVEEKPQEEVKVHESVLTPERLKSLQTLETTVDADFVPIIESINTDFGIKLTPRPEGYHLTIISPPEAKILSSLTPEQINQLQQINATIERGEGVRVNGIGFIDGSKQDHIRESDKIKKTVFLSLDVPALQEFRKSVGLPEKDLHITLGFEGGDIHMEIKGQNEKGKDILGLISKKANPDFDKYLQALPEIKFTALSGQEKQKPKE